MGEGLRERKKRETRQRIAETATELFLQRGFDNVTVAEVARAADVSVNTVFNYFRTKEDLFLDRSHEDLLARVVRERRAGETPVGALRRDFLEALDAGDGRYGLYKGADLFVRRIRESASLSARMLELDCRSEERLGRELADETGADPDDITPWLVAAQVCAVIRTLNRHFAVRRMAGEDAATVIKDVREHAERAFDLLEHGLGEYAARRDDTATPANAERPVYRST